MGKKIKIGLDLDNCITAEPKFFRILCHLLHPEYEIHIITNRDKNSREETVRDLQKLKIQYSKLEITGSKVDYILQQGINILFENEDEYFLELPQSVTVFKIREEGNFSFAEKKWITSRQNSILIDE